MSPVICNPVICNPVICNVDLIIEALNKHTNETFRRYKECEEYVFVSENFDLTETGVYLFTLERVTKDSDTGGFNHWILGEDLTLACVINKINEEMNLS